MWYDWNFYGGKPVLVYTLPHQHTKWQTLKELIPTTFIPERRWYTILYSLAHALKGLHCNGYIHNNICLENINVCHNGKVQVAILNDFSISAVLKNMQNHSHSGNFINSVKNKTQSLQSCSASGAAILRQLMYAFGHILRRICGRKKLNFCIS